MLKINDCIKTLISSSSLHMFALSLYRYISKKAFKLKCCFNGFYIDYMVIVVGQACNYKCIDCANFCPISPKEFYSYPLSSIIRSVDIILKNVRYIEKIQIQGGEPFIYREIGELLAYLCTKRNKIKHIVVATNGSIIPSDNLMNFIGENDVIIRISNYGKSFDKLNILIDKCNRFHVNHSVYNFVSGKSTWFQCGRKDLERQNNDVDKKFQYCLFNHCLTLERGELSHCSRATNSYHIQGFRRKKGDYVKVEDNISFRKQLKRYIMTPMPMEACCYCYGTSNKHIIPAAKQANEF